MHITTKLSKQLFTVRKKYCCFIVCAFGACGAANLFSQQILPDEDHWRSVLPKLTNFWRSCILPKVLAKWYTRNQFMANNLPKKIPGKVPERDSFSTAERVPMKSVLFVVILLSHCLFICHA